MKITVTENGILSLEEVYNGILLKTNDGETILISMRDGGFEFWYEGQFFEAKKGTIQKVPMING